MFKKKNAPDDTAGTREGIYVLELANGNIKLGRSMDLASRLRSHADAVETYGGDVLNMWSCPVASSVEAETLLKRALIARPNCRPLNRGHEVWRGVPFVEVVVTALALLRDSRTFRLGNLPKCAISVFETPDPDAVQRYAESEIEQDATPNWRDANLVAFAISLSVGEEGVPEWAVEEWFESRKDQSRLRKLVRPKRLRLPREGMCWAFSTRDLICALHELGWTVGDFGYSETDSAEHELEEAVKRADSKASRK